MSFVDFFGGYFVGGSTVYCIIRGSIVVTHRDALVFTDLAPHVHTGPEVDPINKVGETTQNTTVSHSLCVLTNDIARAEIYNDACRECNDTLAL